MKQRTIHEQRYARNQLIAQLEADLALNAELLPRARKIASELKASDDKPAFFSRTVDRLKNAPDPAGPAGGGDSYETMLYHLMLTVYEDVKKAGVKQDDDKLGQALQDALDTHVKGLEEDTKKKEVQLDSEKKEKAKKITTEDIHEGFQSAVRIRILLRLLD
jgi:cell division cycle protein 37